MKIEVSYVDFTLNIILGDDCVSIVGNTSRVQIRNFVCGPGHGIR